MAPRPKDKHRTWCKTCQQFEIHSWKDETLHCDKCNTPDTGYKHSEVPEELLIEQRKRYRNQKFEKTDSYLQMLKPEISYMICYFNLMEAG